MRCRGKFGDRVTPEQFRSDLALLGLTQQGFGRVVGMSGRAVQMWAAGDREVPATVAWILDRLRADQIPPPIAPVETDRDAACGEALDPALDALAARAEAAGWHPAEIAAAVLSWTVHRIADHAGADEAVRTLEDAAEVVRLRAA